MSTWVFQKKGHHSGPKQGRPDEKLRFLALEAVSTSCDQLITEKKNEYYMRHVGEIKKITAMLWNFAAPSYLSIN
jgi:hypothetical protein